MRKLITLILMILSFSSTAATDEWLANKIDGYFIDSHDMGLYAHITKSNRGSNHIYFSGSNSNCYAFERNTKSFGIITVNGTRVKANMQCLGGNDGSKADISIATIRGERFVINEFKNKNLVTIEFNNNFIKKFSAKGFTDAWYLLNKQQPAL